MLINQPLVIRLQLNDFPFDGYECPLSFLGDPVALGKFLRKELDLLLEGVVGVRCS